MADTGLAGLAIAFAYGVCSFSMAFANKAVLTSYSYNYPFFLIICQMVFTILLLEGLRLTKTISVTPFTLARSRIFLLPSICYAANCVLALYALEGMNIPMYGVIKRCTPVAILFLGVIVLRKPLPSIFTCISVLMITAGCVVAGFGDVSFDLSAYTCGVASVITQSIYLLLVQRFSDDAFGTVDLLYLNGINTLPMLLVCSLATGEFAPALRNFALADLGFVLTFVLVIVLACLLNYLLFLCTMHNSALTTGVTGSLKAIFQTIVGMFTFGGISINVFTISGILVNFCGGILYTFAKYAANHPSKTPIRDIENQDKLSVHNKETKPLSSNECV